VNASTQRHDPDSMLRFMRILIERYRASAEIGWGDLEILEQANTAVLAHRVTGGEGSMVAVHNLSAESTTVTLQFADLGEDHRLVDLLLDGSITTPSAKGTVELTLDAYGYRWLRVLAPGEKRLS
jgi:hypothetical protein